MRLKAFSIFCLSFLVMFTLTSCDNENLVNEEELNFSGHPVFKIAERDFFLYSFLAKRRLKK